MTRAALSLALLLAAVPLAAQVHVDRPVVLTGASPEDRRVQGLADPVDAGDALNARSHQRGAYAFAAIAGGNTWQVDLQPAPESLTAGMRLRLLVGTGNTGPVQVIVNGLGPVPLVLHDGAPVDSGQVQTGRVAVVVHNGNAFQLLRTEHKPRLDCPAGYVAVNEQYCIQTQQNALVEFTDAAVDCGSQNARLCTWMEWSRACADSTQLGLSNMTGDWEWTNNTANGDGLVRVVGESTCTHSNTSPGWDALPRSYRCCFRR